MTRTELADFVQPIIEALADMRQAETSYPPNDAQSIAYKRGYLSAYQDAQIAITNAIMNALVSATREAAE